MGRDRITNNSLGNSKDNTPIVAEGLVLVDATAAFIVAERKEKGQVKELNGTGFSLKSGSHFLCVPLRLILRTLRFSFVLPQRPQRIPKEPQRRSALIQETEPLVLLEDL
jgi:hypothetical protein